MRLFEATAIVSFNIPNLSLKGKIVLWSTGSLAVILLIFAVTVLFLLKLQLKRELDYRLISETQDVSRSITFKDGELNINFEIEWEEAHHTSDSTAPIILIIIDEQRNEIIRSNNIAQDSLPIARIAYSPDEPLVSTAQLRSNDWRFASRPLNNGNSPKGWVIAGIPFESIVHIENVLMAMYLIAFPSALFLSFAAATVLANRALGPVRKITETVRNIRAKNLDQRVPVPDSEDEIAALAVTMNDLLERLRHNFEAIISFTADASHELKTPIAIIASSIERLDKIITSSGRVEELDTIKNELKRLTRLVDNLTLLAKVDSRQVTMQNGTVWLNDLIYDEVCRFRDAAAAKSINLRCDELPSISIPGDPHWLGIMISNLLDNAVKYSPNRSAIEVGLDLADTGFIKFLVSDDGLGIREEELPNLTKRFFRQNESADGPGSGLGLSIVDWVVKAHRGTLAFRLNSKGGLVVEVSLPMMAEVTQRVETTA